MGLFNLFGGKKKDEAKAKPAETPPKPAEVKPAAAPSLKATAAPASQMVLAPSESGIAQVRLRLKLAASLRAGEHGAAYKAAKDLAAIQAKAGRRVGERVWATEAERILAKQEAA